MKIARLQKLSTLQCCAVERKQGSGGIKAAKSRPPSVRTVAPGRAQNLLAGCIFVGVADKSAFALLSQKVTKEGLRPDTSRTTNVREGSMIMRRIRRSLPDREKGKLIEADYQRYDRERLCQPQQQKIPRKEH